QGCGGGDGGTVRVEDDGVGDVQAVDAGDQRAAVERHEAAAESGGVARDDVASAKVGAAREGAGGAVQDQRAGGTRGGQGADRAGRVGDRARDDGAADVGGGQRAGAQPIDRPRQGEGVVVDGAGRGCGVREVDGVIEDDAALVRLQNALAGGSAREGNGAGAQGVVVADHQGAGRQEDAAAEAGTGGEDLQRVARAV